MGFKILNFNIFRGFQKNDFFGGMKILWILFWDHHNIELYLGVIPMHIRVFLKVKVQNGVYFLGLQKFQIFFWVLDILDILLCEW